MADWGLPLTTSGYANVLAELKARDESLALMFDGTTETNLPVNTIRWNSASFKFQKWDGSTWVNETGRLDITDTLALVNNNEATQLTNINDVTISNAQWGYLGALNQGLTTSSTVSFAGLTVSANATIAGTTTVQGLINATGQTVQCEKIKFDNRESTDLSADGEIIYDLSDGLYYQRGGIVRRIWDDGNDGPGSGLNADLLDGLHASAFAQSGGGNFPNVKSNVVSSHADFTSIYNTSVWKTNSKGTYQNFFNGTIIQYGRYITGSGTNDLNGQANIEFPIFFSGSPHVFVATTQYTGKSNITCNTYAYTGSSALVNVIDLDNGGGENGVTVHWMAIGDTPFIS